MSQLSIELARNGHDVTAFYKANPERDKDFLIYENTNVNLKRVNLRQTVFKVDSLTDILKIRSEIKNGQYDIIHSHSNAIDHAFLASQGLSIPIVANRGMSSPLKWKNALKYKSNKVAHIIAVAEDVKEMMHQTGKVPKQNISVVYGSVDVNRFSPSVESPVTRSQLSIDETAFVIGYTGSIGGRKGIDYFIDAYRKVVKTNANVVLLLIGITNQQLEDNGVLIEPELAPYIKCCGFQHHPEHYMALFDLFVFPGTKSEGLTGAIREAAAMKIPVVTTDVGGNKELIINNVRGVVVQPKDSHALFKAMLLSINNDEKARNMAEQAYQFVIENMTLQVRAQKVLSVYEQAIKNTKSIKLHSSIPEHI